MTDITIIMPSLNVADYISECLESVVCQTFSGLEILCIDAGSTDGTQEIIKSYSHKDARVKLIYSQKKSYGYQVNLGISMAQGRYIGIVETDDFVRPDMYEILYEAIENTELDFVKADYDSFFELNGEYLYKRVRTFPVGEDKYRRVMDSRRLAEVYGRDTTLWKGLYRKSFLSEAHIRLNESPGAAYQDVGFLIQVLGRAGSGMYLDDSLYRYRQDRDGASAVSANCFEHIKNEVEWVLENHILDSADVMHRKSGMERLVGVFLEQYRNALYRHDFRWEDAALLKAHRWFADNMPHYLEQYNAGLREERTELWERYQMALNNPEQFARNCKERHLSVEKILEKLKKSGKFILFGAGARGQAMLRRCADYGIWPFAITDNDSALWGGARGGVPVLAPEECMRQYGDAVYVIANKNSCGAIRRQLVTGGVSEDKIIIM